MSTTLVTALYDIGISEFDIHYNFNNYKEKLQELLKINAPLVIFIPAFLEKIVRDQRKSNLKIIVREFEDLKIQHYRTVFDNNLELTRLALVAKGSNINQINTQIEYNRVNYLLINYAKYDFLEEVSQNNPFSSKYFLWINAHAITSRLREDFSSELLYPDPYKIRILEDNLFLLPNIDWNTSNPVPLLETENFYLSNDNYHLETYILGGKAEIIRKVVTGFRLLLKDILEEGLIVSDKRLLEMLYLENSQNFYLYPKTTEHALITHLAVGTHLPVKYSVNKKITLLTTATREITEREMRKWIKTAEYFGYNYQVVGRENRWAGFSTKIKTFYQALQSITTPYVVMTDCTDFFMCGSAHELCDKFETMGKSLIVSGEAIIRYPGGHHDPKIIKAYFTSIKQSVQAYPNSGFLMGKTPEMLKLMKIHLSYTDDQGPCFDTIYENKLPLEIDYQTKLIGNVPYYKTDDYSRDLYEFDPRHRRYRNKSSGEMPVMFHFPGKYFPALTEYYNAMVPESASNNYESETGLIVLAIIIAIFLLSFVCFVIQESK